MRSDATASRRIGVAEGKFKLLWAISNDVKLPGKARKLIENEENEQEDVP